MAGGLRLGRNAYLKRLENGVTGFTYLPALMGNLFGGMTFLWSVERGSETLPEWWIGMYGLEPVTGISSGAFAWHMIGLRTGQMVLFLLLGMILSYPAAAVLYNLAWGWFYGFSAVSLVFRLGWRGALLGGMCFFPQFLCYFLAVGLFAEGRGRFPSGQKLHAFVRIFVILILCAFAMFWEIRLQKKFLFPYFQHLV